MIYCKNCLHPLSRGDARHGDNICVLPVAVPAGDTREEYVAWLHRQARENEECIPIIILPSHLKRFDEEEGWGIHTCSACGLSFSYRLADAERGESEQEGLSCFFCDNWDHF
nr:hypothetical protein [Candidatus Sigynarchaeum springense]